MLFPPKLHWFLGVIFLISPEWILTTFITHHQELSSAAVYVCELVVWPTLHFSFARSALFIISTRWCHLCSVLGCDITKLVPKTVRNSWNSNENFHLKESSEEVLGWQYRYFGWQWVNLLFVNTSSATCHKLEEMDSHNVLYFTWHPTLPGFHGNIWIIPIKAFL